MEVRRHLLSRSLTKVLLSHVIEELEQSVGCLTVFILIFPPNFSCQQQVSYIANIILIQENLRFQCSLFQVFFFFFFFFWKDVLGCLWPPYEYLSTSNFSMLQPFIIPGSVILYFIDWPCKCAQKVSKIINHHDRGNLSKMDLFSMWELTQYIDVNTCST